MYRLRVDVRCPWYQHLCSHTEAQGLRSREFGAFATFVALLVLPCPPPICLGAVLLYSWVNRNTACLELVLSCCVCDDTPWGLPHVCTPQSLVTGAFDDELSLCNP